MISREDLISQSVFDYAEAKMRARGYPADRVEFTDSFPYDSRDQGLTRTLVAAGFDFDDQGTPTGCGEAEITRLYTVQYIVFAPNDTEARNVANVVKFLVEAANLEGGIPLVDVNDAAKAIIDRLEVEGVSADRQIIPDAEPWQENVWTTTAKIRDTYTPFLV